MTEGRAYLDWNASAPLRAEARMAMLAAMDAAGNPAGVHAEGRAARAVIEKARGQVAALAGCDPAEIVFTSGATEAAASVLSKGRVRAMATEHDCVFAHVTAGDELPVQANGLLCADALAPSTGWSRPGWGDAPLDFIACQRANSETGVIQDIEALAAHPDLPNLFVDAAQAMGKIENALPARSAAAISSPKIGGPKGCGALILRAGAPGERPLDLPPLLKGGGQESGRRSGTENVVGIAGFGAAAEAARRDLADGVWARVAQLRDALEARLETAAPDLILMGRGTPRLPNTSCFAVPGWAGETQVMQMDLAGFAVSAGSACSSGKVEKASRALRAMGFDEVTASSAVRVSLGPTTGEAEVMAFADAWIGRYQRRSDRAA